VPAAASISATPRRAGDRRSTQASLEPTLTKLHTLKRALPIVLLALLSACGEDDKQTTGESPDPSDPSNAVPVIDGAPATKAVVGDMYEFAPVATDADGDTLTFAIDNRPGWAAFSPSTGRLSGRPPSSAAARVYAGIRISVSDSKATAELPAFDLEVEADSGEPPANTPPTISGSPDTTATVGNSYSFTSQASDPDGQVLSFSITNKPSWTSFDSVTGELAGTPSDGDVGAHTGIVISVSDGEASSTLPAFEITVSAGAPPPPVNQPPTIRGTPPQAATVGASYSFQPTASDPDGQALTFSISGKPTWATFNSSTGRLSGTPASAGTQNGIRISVSDGTDDASLPAFTITVVPGNVRPQISGTPATSVTVGQAYSFQPTASDPDGQTLEFSISNRPRWASFSMQTGRLSGTPGTADTGSYNNVQISVTDGIAVSTLPAFSVRVDAANRAPTISGTPPVSVSVDQIYDFRPTASDLDGDTLTFTVDNKPSWASFDAASGRLWGTPSAGDAGTYSAIRISVSDGTATAALAAFAIDVQQVQLGSVTLSWTPPTQNEDGSPLTNLRGYRIHYGTSSSALNATIEIAQAGITTAVIENLAPATWYFAVKAYTTAGVESAFSNIASKRID
jgi:Putative Ig domain